MEGPFIPTASSEADVDRNVDLRRCPNCPLKDLDLGGLEDALARGDVISTFEVPARARFSVAGYADGHLLTLRKGLLKFGMVDGGGRCTIAGLRYPGDPIEPYCKIQGGQPFLEAVLDSTVCVLDLRVVERDPAVATRVLTRRLDQVNALLRSAERHHSAFVGQPPDARAAILLLQLLEKPIHRVDPKSDAQGDPDRPSIRLFLSRSEIAECLGLAVETVSRTLSRMADNGLITKQGRNRIRLDDLPALRRLAGLKPPD